VTVEPCLRAYWCRLPHGHPEVECLPKGDNWRAWMRKEEDEVIEATKKAYPGYTGPAVPHPDDFYGPEQRVEPEP
jgi:hypothetical protein